MLFGTEKPIPPKPEVDEIINMIKIHLGLVVAEKGEYAAVREMRKHISWYAKGIKNASNTEKKTSMKQQPKSK